jgi:hypothetical protein
MFGAVIKAPFFNTSVKANQPLKSFPPNFSGLGFVFNQSLVNQLLLNVPLSHTFRKEVMCKIQGIIVTNSSSPCLLLSYQPHLCILKRYIEEKK